jgi:hypothetical protein
MNFTRSIQLSALCILSLLFASKVDAATVELATNPQDIVMDHQAGCRARSQLLTSESNVLCAITGVGGEFAGGGEIGRVISRTDGWHFEGNACKFVVFTVTCFRFR